MTHSLCTYAILLVVGMLIQGCRPDAAPNGPATSHVVGDVATEEGPQWSDWSTPVNLGPLINAVGASQDGGSGVTQVSGGESRPAWSPDGTRIAYGSEDCDADYGCYPVLLVVSADGAYGAYLSDQGNLDPARRPR